MVAQFVRLKLTLLANAFRRSVWQTIGFVLAALYGLGVIALLVIGMIVLGSTDVELAGTVLVLAGTLAVLAWWIGPLFLFGVDATLDPRRFVLFPIPRRTLLAGLAAAGVVSIPGMVTVLAALGASLGFWRDLAALGLTLVGAVVAIALCIVGSRAWTTALAPVLESRRYREVVTVAAFVPLVLLGPAFAWFGQQMGESSEGGGEAVRAAVEQIAAVAAWTPFGAPWGLADAALSGAWGLVVARLAIALASLALVWWVWDRALGRALVTPASAGAAKRVKGIGWFDRFASTPTGAVAARCTTYWLRDPRYSGSIAVVPLLPVILYVVGRGGPGPEILLALGPFTGWLLGFAISADIAYDNSAFALHVSSGVRGRADRWGRAIPVLVFGGLITLVFTVAAVGVAGDWSALPAVLGAAAGTLLVSVGVSSVSSARLLYPVPKPGDSPFKQPQGAAMATMTAQLVAMTAMLVLTLPVLVLAAVAVFGSVAWAGWAALVVGLGIGVAALLVGVRWGGRLYDRGAPELLQRVMAFA